MKSKESVNDFTTHIKSRFVKSFLDILILRLVEAEPKWGYDIIKRTEADYSVRLRHGALYPMLNRLEAKGLLKSRKELKKGRVRKVYEITQTGKQVLDMCQEFLREQIS